MGSLRYRIGRQKLLSGTEIGTALLIFFSFSSLAFAQGWKTSPVVSRLLTASIDDSAHPSLVITPDRLVYITFTLAGGKAHYYTKEFPGFPGIFSGFSSIPSFGGPYTHGNGPENLLAVDSGSTLHYITSIAPSGNPFSCLRHALNHANATILTAFGHPDTVRDRACNEILGGSTTGLDALGRLHLVSTVGDSILYFQRSADGIWSDGIRLSDPTTVNFAPSLSVTPSGEVHLTFLSRPTAQDKEVTIFYTHGSGDTFENPLPLATRQGIGAEDPVPIVVDPAGVCHVAFIDQSTGATPSIRYRENGGGDWNPVEIVMADPRYTFGHLSLTCDRYGAMHIVGGYSLNDVDSLPDRELFYTTNASGVWSAPANITANDVEDNVFNAGNGFLAGRDSLLAVAYTSSFPTGERYLALSRLLLDFNPYLEAAPDTIALGTLQLGTFDTSIVLHNRGQRLYERLRVDKVEIVDAGDPPLKILPSAMPNAIRGGDSLAFPLMLKGEKTGAFAVRVAFNSNGGSDTVVLTGWLIDSSPLEHLIRLDTVSTDVGSIARLTCRISPPLDMGEGIDTLVLHLAFKAEALFFQERIPLDADAPQINASFSEGKETLSVTLAGKEGARFLAGSDLFAIDFKGLLTGDPENPVALSLEPRPRAAGVSTSPGRIDLIGCEVAKDLHFRQAGFAGRITPNPVRDYLSFPYIAPSGVSVGVRFVDLLGADHLRLDLPSGTGGVEDAHLDLRSLPPGFYLVELRVGERVITDMMLKE